MNEILKLVAAQSTATLGAVMRAWLVVVGVVAAPLTIAIIADEWSRHGVGMLDRVQNIIGFGIAAGILLSIPVMVVLAIIHIARKW